MSIYKWRHSTSVKELKFTDKYRMPSNKTPTNVDDKREQHNQRKREYRDRNLELERARYRDYYQRNKERERERRKARYQARKEQERLTGIKWRAANPHKLTAMVARRRAAKRAATPPDADHAKINDFYKRARFLNELYGCDLQVDHVTPLDAGIEAGGIHCHTNLQLLDGSLNKSKGTKTDWVHPYCVDEIELTDSLLISWLATFQ